MDLTEPLSNSLKDVQEVIRTQSAQILGLLWAYGCENDQQFDEHIQECLTSLPQRTVEQKHGWFLVLGHAFSKRIDFYKENDVKKDFAKWKVFREAVKVLGTFKFF